MEADKLIRVAVFLFLCTTMLSLLSAGLSFMNTINNLQRIKELHTLTITQDNALNLCTRGLDRAEGKLEAVGALLIVSSKGRESVDVAEILSGKRFDAMGGP